MIVNINSSLCEQYLMYKVFKIQEHIGLQRRTITNVDHRLYEK